jgi:hypothetical protein
MTRPRALRRSRAAWSVIRSPRLRQIREDQHRIAATGPPCWRATADGRAMQAGMQRALDGAS